jgi:hypothetical protein
VGQRHASTYQTQRKKTLIVREWKRWLQAHSINPWAATPRDTLNFFYELQDKRSPLLKFHPRGRDKWKIINGWLLGEQEPSKAEVSSRKKWALRSNPDAPNRASPRPAEGSCRGMRFR